MKRFLLFLALISSLQVFGRSWNSENDPSHFEKVLNSKIISKLGDLPVSGYLNDKRLGWSESYWPSYLGGVAYRWNSSDPKPFTYALKTKSQLMNMPRVELEALSPAELYDISQGDYSYSLTNKVLSLHRPQDLWWAGLCDGWAQASANYPEPRRVLVVNPDGIKVPFGSSDVKALLSMHDTYYSRGVYARVGSRCEVRGKVPGEAIVRDGRTRMPPQEEAMRAECEDVNAGSFHIIISNMIGIHSRSVIADIDRFSDVWNQPVVSYSSELKEEMYISDKERASGVVRKIRVMTKMIYSEELQFFSEEARSRGEINFVSKLPVTRTHHQAYRYKSYEYGLELNAQGEIIGGEWISATRPDLLWIKTRDKNFNEPLSGLKHIYLPVKY